jgi:hypothetical protein
MEVIEQFKRLSDVLGALTDTSDLAHDINAFCLFRDITKRVSDGPAGAAPQHAEAYVPFDWKQMATMRAAIAVLAGIDGAIKECAKALSIPLADGKADQAENIVDEFVTKVSAACLGCLEKRPPDDTGYAVIKKDLRVFVYELSQIVRDATDHLRPDVVNALRPRVMPSITAFTFTVSVFMSILLATFVATQMEKLAIYGVLFAVANIVWITARCCMKPNEYVFSAMIFMIMGYAVFCGLDIAYATEYRWNCAMAVVCATLSLSHISSEVPQPHASASFSSSLAPLGSE